MMSPYIANRAPMKNQIGICLLCESCIDTYQKTMFTATNAMLIMAAQNIGLLYQGHGASSGKVVSPSTRSFSSESCLGLVTRLTRIVTLTPTTSDHQALYIFTAIGLAFSDRAISFACCGLKAAGANFSEIVEEVTCTPGFKST